MKKSTIWILGVVMGLSFLSLLYLQISYIEEMVKMRNEQFDGKIFQRPKRKPGNSRREQMAG